MQKARERSWAFCRRGLTEVRAVWEMVRPRVDCRKYINTKSHEAGTILSDFALGEDLLWPFTRCGIIRVA